MAVGTVSSMTFLFSYGGVADQFGWLSEARFTRGTGAVKPGAPGRARLSKVSLQLQGI